MQLGLRTSRLRGTTALLNYKTDEATLSGQYDTDAAAQRAGFSGASRSTAAGASMKVPVSKYTSPVPKNGSVTLRHNHAAGQPIVRALHGFAE